MGNLAFISFRRAVSDDQFTAMLREVVEGNYGSCFEVIANGGGWVVQPKEEAIGVGGSPYSYMLNIFRAHNYSTDKPYKGKFEHKHMRGGPWGSWFMHQIHGHFCDRFGATLGDEGVRGSFKIDPHEYPTAREYNMGLYEFYNENPDHLELFLAKVPPKLRKLRG